MHTEAAFNYSPMSKLKSNNELGPKINGYHVSTNSSTSNDLNNNHNNDTISSNGETISRNGPHSDDNLDTCILRQLEFYFSRENLLHDKYLVSQMDSDNYVSISVLCQFNKIKKLFAASADYSSSGDDHRVLYIQQLVKQNANSKLQLDSSGTKMRANHKRCVVILREISKETPVDAILNIFAECSVKCLNCEFAAARSWYLTFKDEHEAQLAVQFIKEQAQTFNDEPLFARIKTNPIPRVNSASGNEQDKAAPDTDSKHVAYSLYPAYYYPADFPFVANPWMFYPSQPQPPPPNHFYPNFSKTKQTSIDKANMSSASSGYMINETQPPLMFSYTSSYPASAAAFKRKHAKSKTADTADPSNSSQNEDTTAVTTAVTATDDNNTDKRGQYSRRNYNIATYNQNFIILPNPAASFGYASPPHLAYPNVAMYPSFAPQPALHHQQTHHLPQQQQQQASSSSTSSTSSRPSVNQSDAFKSNQFRPNRFNGGKKYIAAGQSPRPNGDKVYDAKSERSNGAKFSKLNGGRLAPSYRKNAGRNGAGRRDDVAVQFDYEPTSFPPLNDKHEDKCELQDDCEQFVLQPDAATTAVSLAEITPVEMTATNANELNSAWSRKSFAEIVKIPNNTLSQEMAKLAISED